MMLKTLFAAVGVTAIAQAAIPSATVDVPQFRQIELIGGGDVTLRHGERQRVTLTGMRPELTRMSVDEDGKLTIRACADLCSGGSVPRIVIVTPSPLEGVAIRRGGRIRGEGRWPAQSSLATAVSSGGDIDVTAIPTTSAVAAIGKGGSIALSARTSLVATTSGGGVIRYRGTPQITQVTRGGGSVEPIRD